MGSAARLLIGAALVLAASSTVGAEPSWGTKPLSHWVRVLGAGDQAARIDATYALTQIALANGPESILPALPLLGDALRAESPLLRSSAAAALEQIGSGAAPAQTALLELLEQDPEADVRAHAGLALTRIAPADAAVVDACGRVLGRDSEARVRQSAAALLVQAGPAAEPVTAAIERALTDGDAVVRVFAAGAAGQLGRTSLALPVLLAGLTHEDPAVRAEAAGMLAAVAPAHAAAVAPLITALSDREGQVRSAAAEALGQIGQPARSALQPLWRLMRDPDEQVRETALSAIRRIRG